MLYEFVFLCSEDDSPFCVCTCYPRGCVSCSSSESLGGVDLSSLLVVEKTGEDLVDPIKLLPVSVEVSCLLVTVMFISSSGILVRVISTANQVTLS